MSLFCFFASVANTVQKYSPASRPLTSVEVPSTFTSLISLVNMFVGLTRSVYETASFDGFHSKWIDAARGFSATIGVRRSEEHTSELQSRRELVCRLLLEKTNRRPLTETTAP